MIGCYQLQTLGQFSSAARVCQSRFYLLVLWLVDLAMFLLALKRGKPMLCSQHGVDAARGRALAQRAKQLPAQAVTTSTTRLCGQTGVKNWRFPS
jgi:hypothetical protein